MNVSLFGHNYEIAQIECAEYRNPKNLAIQLYNEDKEYGGLEPFAMLTVNLAPLSQKNLAYIDTNNNPWAPEFIEKYHLGKDTGLLGFSGYCAYPLYEMDLDELAKYKGEAA